MPQFPCRAARMFFASALSALLLSGAAAASGTGMTRQGDVSGAFLVPVEEFVFADGAFVVPEDEFVMPEEEWSMPGEFVDPAAYMDEQELEGDYVLTDEDAFLVPEDEFVVPEDFIDPAAYMETSAPTAGDMGLTGEVIGVGQTTGSSLRMRSEPSTDSGVVMSLNRDVTLAILDDSRDDWYKVSYNGNVGYVSANYLHKVDNSGFETYARVRGEGVYVRETPSDDANILNIIDNEAIVTVNALENGWYHVTCKYGTVGYIHSSSLDLISSSSSVSGMADKIIATAMQYRGVRYVYGGTTPRGFDCSGFTKYVFARNGITLPRTASTQWSSGLGTRVYSRSALQKGDLVFFNDPRRNAGKSCSHVGIYIGDGQFIHASSGGSGVTVSNLSANYYSTYFKGGLHFNWS